MSNDCCEEGVLNGETYQKPSLFVKGVELFLQNIPSVTSLSRNVYLRFQSFYDEESLVYGP
jgi:hypothetical protein